MNRVAGALVFILVTAGLCAAGEKPPVDQTERESYSLGFRFGDDFRKQGFDINLEALMRGMQDALKRDDPLMDRKEMNSVLTNLRKRVLLARQKEFKEQAAENMEKGKAFLEENSKREGVVILPSGLQYKVVTQGTGQSPTADDTVTVDYRGAFIDGTEFDSTYSRGKPEKIQVNSVISGLTEALQLMKAGASWQIFIPPELAYGKKGWGKQIAPNSTVVFDVELISIN